MWAAGADERKRKPGKEGGKEREGQASRKGYAELVLVNLLSTLKVATMSNLETTLKGR